MFAWFEILLAWKRQLLGGGEQKKLHEDSRYLYGADRKHSEWGKEGNQIKSGGRKQINFLKEGTRDLIWLHSDCVHASDCAA